MSNADELLKLKELLESGLLSEEEFSIEKNKILNRKDDLINTNLEKTNYKTPNIKCNSKKTNMGFMWNKFIKNQCIEIQNDRVTHYKEYDEELIRQKNKMSLFKQNIGHELIYEKSLHLSEVFSAHLEVDETIKKQIDKGSSFMSTYWISFNIRTNRDYIRCDVDYFDKENLKIIEDLYEALYPLIKDNKPTCPNCGSEFIRAARGRVGMATVGILASKTKVKCGTCKQRFDNYL